MLIEHLGIFGVLYLMLCMVLATILISHMVLLIPPVRVAYKALKTVIQVAPLILWLWFVVAAGVVEFLGVGPKPRKVWWSILRLILSWYVFISSMQRALIILAQMAVRLVRHNV